MRWVRNYNKLAQDLKYKHERNMWEWLYTVCHLGPYQISRYLARKGVIIHPETIRSRMERMGMHKITHQENEDFEHEIKDQTFTEYIYA